MGNAPGEDREPSLGPSELTYPTTNPGSPIYIKKRFHLLLSDTLMRFEESSAFLKAFLPPSQNRDG